MSAHVAVLVVSLFLQGVAALLAVRLIRVTRRAGWSLIAAAVLLMAGRRLYTLKRLLTDPMAPRPDLEAETIALAISALMALGLALIAPLFHSMERSEAALAASERRYRSVVTALGHGILVRDAAGVIRMCNPSAERLLGRTAAEIVGRRAIVPSHLPAAGPGATVLPDESDPAQAALRTGMGSREILTAVQTPEGELRWLAVNTVPLFDDASGRATGVVSSFREVTEQKRTEQVLGEIVRGVSSRTGEAFFRSLVEHLGEALGVHCVLAGEIVGGESRVRTVAFWEDGRIRDNIEYDLSETPCKDVMDGEICVYPRRVRELFPGDPHLSATGVESYCGMPLYDSYGQCLGLLVVMDRRPLEQPAHVQSMVQIFGVRAAAELERLRTEEARRRAEEKYRSIVDNAVEGIFQSTPEGRLLTANPALARILGYDGVDDLLAGPRDLEADLYASPDERQELVRHLESASEVRGLEHRLRRRDGSIVWVSENARVVRGPDGRPAFYEGTLVDITERRLAAAAQADLQARVREAAHEWQATFDAFASPVLVTALDGRVLGMNQAAREMAALPDANRLTDLGSGSFWNAAAEASGAVGTTRLAHTIQASEEGTGRTWQIVASLCERSDADRVIVVAHDITESIALQESVRRSETLSAMGRLLAGVAHEVRNPLFGISATLDAFDADFRDQPEYQQYSRLLRGEVGRLTHLMEELLDYGRPAAARLDPGCVARVVARASASCAAFARNEGVVLSVEAEPSLPPVAMDAHRLAQVFQNLIENAVQHSPRGGTVRLSCRNGPAGVECVVEDSGKGFVPEDMVRAFEPFFTRRRGGTGLGLAIVQRIVEEHGGRVDAANRPTGGAAVSVVLPALRTAAG